MTARFWVLGPVQTIEGDEMWGVVDGHDLPGQHRARKPNGYQEFWNSEDLAKQHAEYMNLRAEAWAESLDEVAKEIEHLGPETWLVHRWTDDETDLGSFDRTVLITDSEAKADAYIEAAPKAKSIVTGYHYTKQKFEMD